MRLKKQSMREVRDAALRERAVRIVETVGDIALETVAARVPGNTDRPRYFRGALIKPR